MLNMETLLPLTYLSVLSFTDCNFFLKNVNYFLTGKNIFNGGQIEEFFNYLISSLNEFFRMEIDDLVLYILFQSRIKSIEAVVDPK